MRNLSGDQCLQMSGQCRSFANDRNHRKTNSSNKLLQSSLVLLFSSSLSGPSTTAPFLHRARPGGPALKTNRRRLHLVVTNRLPRLVRPASRHGLSRPKFEDCLENTETIWRTLRSKSKSLPLMGHRAPPVLPELPAVPLQPRPLQPRPQAHTCDRHCIVVKKMCQVLRQLHSGEVELS